MQTKYIRPTGLIGNTRNSKLVQNRHFISKEEYDQKVDVIKETLKTVLESLDNTDESLNSDYTSFLAKEQEINQMTNEIIQYVDKVVNEENDLEKIKFNLQKYINECVATLETRLSELYDADYRSRVLSRVVYDTLETYYTSHFYEKDINDLQTKKVLNDGKGNILVLLEDGTLLASGTNQNGELGIGNTNPTEFGTFVTVPGIFDIDDISVVEGGFSATKKDGTILKSGIIYDLIAQAQVEKTEYTGLITENETDIVKLVPGTFDCLVDEKEVKLINAEKDTDISIDFNKTENKPIVNVITSIWIPFTLNYDNSLLTKGQPILLMKYRNKNCCVAIFVKHKTGGNIFTAASTNELEAVFGILDLDSMTFVKSIPITNICNKFSLERMTDDYIIDFFRVIRDNKEYVCFKRIFSYEQSEPTITYHLFDLESMTIYWNLPSDYTFEDTGATTHIQNVLNNQSISVMHKTFNELYSDYNNEKVSIYYTNTNYLVQNTTKTVKGIITKPNSYKASDKGIENPFIKLYEDIKDTDGIAYTEIPDETHKGQFTTSKKTKIIVKDRIKGKIIAPNGKVPEINYDTNEISLKDDTLVWPRIVYQPFVLNNKEIDNVGIFLSESHYITESVEYSGIYDVYEDHKDNDASNEPGRLFLLNKVNNRNTVVITFQFGKQEYNGQTTVATDSRYRTSGYIGVFDLDTSELISYKQNNPAETSNEIKYFNDAWSMYSNLFKVNSFGNNDNNRKGFICGTIYEQSYANNSDYVWRKKKVHLMDPLTLETIAEYEPNEFENVLNTSSFNYVNNRIEITRVNETNVIDGHNGAVMKGFDPQTNLSVYFLSDSSNNSESGMGIGKIKESPDPVDFEIKRVDLDTSDFTSLTQTESSENYPIILPRVLKVSSNKFTINDGYYGEGGFKYNYIDGFELQMLNSLASEKQITIRINDTIYFPGSNTSQYDGNVGAVFIKCGDKIKCIEKSGTYTFELVDGKISFFRLAGMCSIEVNDSDNSFSLGHGDFTSATTVENESYTLPNCKISRLTSFDRAFFSSERYNDNPKLSSFISCDIEESDPDLFKYVTTLSYSGNFTNFDFKYKQVKSEELNKNSFIFIFVDNKLTDTINGMDEGKEWDSYENANILSINESHKLDLVFVSFKGNNDCAYSIVDQLNPHTPVENVIVDENNNSPFHNFKIDTNIEIISTIDESTGERTEVLKNTGFKAVKITPTNDNKTIRFKIKKSSSSSETEEVGCVFLYDKVSNKCICMEPEEGGYQLPQLFDDTVKNYKIYYGNDVPDLDESFDTSNLWLIIVGEIMIGDREGFEIGSTSESYLTIPSIYESNPDATDDDYVRRLKELQSRNIAFYPIQTNESTFKITLSDELMNDQNIEDILDSYAKFIERIIVGNSVYIEASNDLIYFATGQGTIENFIPIFPFYLGNTKLIIDGNSDDTYEISKLNLKDCYIKKYYNNAYYCFNTSNVFNAFGVFLNNSGSEYNRVGGSGYTGSREWILYNCKTKINITTGYICIGGTGSTNIIRDIEFIVINTSTLKSCRVYKSGFTIYPASNLSDIRSRGKIEFNLECKNGVTLLIWMHYVGSSASDSIRLFSDNVTTSIGSLSIGSSYGQRVFEKIQEQIFGKNIQKTDYSSVSTNENLIAENFGGDIKKYEIKKGLNIFNHYGNLNDIIISPVKYISSSAGPLSHLFNSSLVYLFDVESNKIIRKLSLSTKGSSGKFSNISGLDENKEYKILWFLKDDFDDLNHVYNISGFKDSNGNLINPRDNQISILSNSYYEIENPNGSSVERISIKCPNEQERYKYQILYILYGENDNIEKINIENFNNTTISIDLKGYYKLNCLILDSSNQSSTESINNPMNNNFFNIYKRNLDGTSMEVILPESCTFVDTGVDTYSKDSLIEIKMKNIDDLYTHLNDENSIDLYLNSVKQTTITNGGRSHNSKSDAKNTVSYVVKDIPYGETPDIIYRLMKNLSGEATVELPKKYRDTLLLLKNFRPGSGVTIQYTTPEGMTVEETYIANKDEIVPDTFKKYVSSLVAGNKKIAIIDSGSVSADDHYQKDDKVTLGVPNTYNERSNNKYVALLEYNSEEDMKNGYFIANYERVKCIKIMNDSANSKYKIKLIYDYKDIFDSDNMEDYILVDDLQGSVLASAYSSKRSIKSKSSIFR